MRNTHPLNHPIRDYPQKVWKFQLSPISADFGFLAMPVMPTERGRDADVLGLAVTIYTYSEPWITSVYFRDFLQQSLVLPGPLAALASTGSRSSAADQMVPVCLVQSNARFGVPAAAVFKDQVEGRVSDGATAWGAGILQALKSHGS
ncbi:MAG: hypothetical protein M1829_002241 [Trizodia sp. TS-e1964]|nr:MAG: hypothetical protein M1829_002241 [Trizodia sp. TS-e1964]